MDRSTLEIMLGTAGLGLERSGERFVASSERSLTLTLVAAGETLRFSRVVALVMAPELTDAGLVGLEREESYVVVELGALVAIERDRDEKESEKRRTGFL